MTKKCSGPIERGGSSAGDIAEGTRPVDACRRTVSVKVAELIVQARFDRRIGEFGGTRLGGFLIDGRGAAARPADRDQSNADEAARAEDIWHGPRQAVESRVNRSSQRLLAAVLRDVILDDLIARLALVVDEARQFGPHLGGPAALTLG